MDTRTPPTAHRPRVRVTQPRGGVIDARLRWWHRDDAGAWWALVEYDGWAAGADHVYVMVVPAGAVTRLQGEDYSGVARKQARR